MHCYYQSMCCYQGPSEGCSLPAGRCPYQSNISIVPETAQPPYNPYTKQANLDYMFRAGIDVTKAEAISSIKKRDAEDLAVIKANLDIEKSSAGCSVELNAAGYPVASFDLIGRNALKKPLIEARINAAVYQAAYPSKKRTVLELSLTRPGTDVPAVVTLTDDEQDGKTLLRKLRHLGFSVITSSHRKKELMDDFIALLIRQATVITIPASHGWFLDGTTWLYADESTRTLEDI